MGMSQMCAGADHYFRSSKPHSRKLCITMMLHNIHTDLVATGNASTTWTPPKAKVSVNVVKHHCYINMNILCP